MDGSPPFAVEETLKRLLFSIDAAIERTCPGLRGNEHVCRVPKDAGYSIEYTVATKEHLRALTARQRSTVLDAVERQLTHQASVVTRNRKRMRPNSLALWELRVGSLRV